LARLLTFADEAGRHQEVHREAALERLEQVAPAVGGGAGADPLQRLLLEATAEQVLAGPRPRSRPEVPLEVLAGGVEEREHLVALLAVRPLLVLVLRHRDPEPPRDKLDGLREA